MKDRFLRTPHPTARSRRQGGVAALGLAAAMVVFVGTLAGIAHLERSGNGTLPGAPEAAALQWADDGVRGFVATQGRLPCPARAPGGPEHCDAAFGKGWLPVASIEAFGPSPDAPRPWHVRYAVYRGTGGATSKDPDLAVAEDAYRPSTAPGYPVFIRSGFDLCGKLHGAMPADGALDRWRRVDAASADPARSDRANVASTTQPAGLSRIAYGLAVTPRGALTTDSNLNADPSAQLESPLRRLDGGYRDLVRAVDFDTLYQALSCPIALASIDTLAMAADWTDEAVGMRAGTITGSQAVVRTEAVILASEGVGLISSGIDLTAAIWTGLKSGNLVTASTPGLPFTLPAFLSGTAGILTSMIANANAVIDTARDAIGLATEAAYTATYDKLARTAESSRVWASAAPVLAAADLKGTAP